MNFLPMPMNPFADTDSRSMNRTPPSPTSTSLPLAGILSRGAGRVIALAAALFFLVTATAGAATAYPPDRMTYQGFLVDANGVPLATNNPANYPVVFRIYDEATGGNLLWSEQQIVTVDRGNFSVLLGEGSDFGSEVRPDLSTVFAGATASDRFIGITVTIDTVSTEILPRLRLLPGAYAYLARYANGLVGEDGTPVVGIATSGGASEISVGGKLTAGQIVGSSGTFSGPVEATGFVGNGTIPLGGIILWSGSAASVPAGWALCDGRTVNGRTTPNLADRFVVGAGGSYSVGAAGGEATTFLNVNQLPPHSHSFQDGYFVETYGGGVGGNIWLGGNYGGSGDTDSDNDWIWYRNAITFNTGSGAGVENRPPYLALAYIMRVQ